MTGLINARFPPRSWCFSQTGLQQVPTLSGEEIGALAQRMVDSMEFARSRNDTQFDYFTLLVRRQLFDLGNAFSSAHRA
jgi:hypothetical protein